MKQHHIALSSLWITITLPVSATLFPNGAFNDAAGDSWEEVSGGGTFTFDYPATGGNQGGYGIIDHTAADGGFGIWVGNSGQPLELDDLGLQAGKTYNFTMDMTLLSGSNIGGFKLDFTNGGSDAGSTGDIRVTLIGDGSTWETYTFPIAIPTGVDGFKVVPLWGVDSSVGYDNIGYDPTPIVQPPIINPGFSNGSLGWTQVGSAETSWSYPATGGNPDNYGLMTNTGAGFGIWVANGDQVISLESLGLEAGTTINFLQDMKLFSGTNIGGLKIDFFTAGAFSGSTGDVFGTLIGDGSTWETYTFPVALPAGIDGIKIVPLWGAGSSVGYDNIRVYLPAPRIEASSYPTYVQGTLVSWTPPADSTKLYQPQWSADGNNWVDFGPAYPGSETSSILDPNNSEFYRVIAKEPEGPTVIVNGSFESLKFNDPAQAEYWDLISNTSQVPTRITTDFVSGEAAMRIAVQNDTTPTANQAEIQQNLANSGSSVIAGETYTLSFQAKQISSGLSYVQRYRLQWLSGEALAGGEVGFVDFSGGDGTWKKITAPGLTAPAGADGALLQIFGTTGAVASTDAKGEVLIDDVILSVSVPTEVTPLETTTTPGSGVFMRTEVGKFYQAQESDDLQNFNDLSSVFPGNGQSVGAGIPAGGPSHFYRFLEIPDVAN